MKEFQRTRPPSERVVDHVHATLGIGPEEDDWSSVLYAAVAEADGSVSAHVVLYSDRREQAQRWISLKQLHEQSLTEHRGVTGSLLDKLTTTAHLDAIEWRRRAREHLQLTEQALGSVIRLHRPLIYREIGQIDTVRVVSPTQFRAAYLDADATIREGALLQTPQNWTMTEFEILVPADRADTGLGAAALAAAAPGLGGGTEPSSPTVFASPAFDGALDTAVGAGMDS
jgi:hypothetical protein